MSKERCVQGRHRASQAAAKRLEGIEHDVGSRRGESSAAESGPVATPTVSARREAARDVGDGVADVDRRAVLAQRRDLAVAVAQADDDVDGQPDVLEARLRPFSFAVTTIVRPPCVDGGDRIARAWEQRRARHAEHEVVGAVAGGQLGDARLVDPVGELDLERRTEPADDGLDVDVDARLGDQRLEAGADAGPGVDQRHVEIEPDDETAHEAETLMPAAP